MLQKSKKCIFLILCMAVCIAIAPCTVAFAAENKDTIQTTVYIGKSKSPMIIGNDFIFYSPSNYTILTSDVWAALSVNNKEFIGSEITFPKLTDLGSFKPASNIESLYDGCTGYYEFSLPEKVSNKIMRLPIPFKWVSNSSTDAMNLNCVGFQDSLDYMIQFKVVVNCSVNDSKVLSSFPLYMLFFDNESGIRSNYFNEHGGYWRNFYVRRQVADSMQYITRNSDGTMSFALNFKIVMPGSDLRYCRTMVLQFPIDQSTIQIATSDCYVNVYNPNYQAIINGAGNEQEKKESESTANNAISDSNDSMSNAIGNSGDSVQSGFSGLIDTLSTSDTSASWQLGKVYLPAISGVMDEIDLLEPQSINFDTYIAMIPKDIMTLIRAITTIVLIIFCIKELYSTISYVLTLNNQGGTD